MNRQAGLSVVELMISVVIGLVVIAGAVQVVVSSKRSFLDQDEVAFIQNNARYAIDIVARDIRMAGYLGCAGQGSAEIANSINAVDTTYLSLSGIQGFDGATNTNTFPADYRDDAKVGTDSFIIRRADDSVELDVAAHMSTAAVIQLWQTHSFKKSTPLIISDAACRNIGLFEVSGPSGLPSKELAHGTGAGVNNCTGVIKGNFTCASGCSTNKCGHYEAKAGGYSAGSKVRGFLAHAYYIGESDTAAGLTALKRRVYSANSGATLFTEEVALGVEDMEITYGIDTDRDGAVNRFVEAAAVTQWEQVVTVQLALVIRSQSVGQLPADARTYAGTTYNDRFIRQEFNSTVRIRNRG